MKILFELSALACACLETLKGSLWSLLFSYLAIICLGGQCEYNLISILETKTQLICKPRTYLFSISNILCTAPYFLCSSSQGGGGAAYPCVTRNTQRHTVACCHDVQAIMSWGGWRFFTSIMVLWDHFCECDSLLMYTMLAAGVQIHI